MRQDHRFQRKGGLSDTQKRMLPVVLIPLIVIVLMIVIVIADHSKEKADAPEPALPVQETEGQEAASNPGKVESGSEPEGESDEPEETQESEEAQEPEETQESENAGSEPEETEAVSILQQDGVPEIRDLIVRYYQARATADAETINQIYNVGEVPAYMLEIQKVQLANNAKYLSGVSNVVTYVTAGLAADSWLVYSTADLQFYASETAAPMIMWCYVTKGEDGAYHIVKDTDLSAEELQYVDSVNRSREVRQLAAGINGLLKEALSSDEALNEVYGILHDGSPVWEGKEETEPEVVILESEGAEAEETAEVESGAEPEDSAEEAKEAETESGAGLSS